MALLNFVLLCVGVSIPIWCDLKVKAIYKALLAFVCFNSNLVRFKVNVMKKQRDLTQVSIPIWCDLKMNSNIDIKKDPAFQFQFGAI